MTVLTAVGTAMENSMSGDNVFIPSEFFDSEAWNERRVFSEAEARLDVMNISHLLAERWGWSIESTKRFIRHLDERNREYDEMNQMIAWQEELTAGYGEGDFPTF